MATRADVVSQARTWLGTPFRHQSAMKGVACDCVGLIRGVAAEVGLFSPDVDTLKRILRYTRLANPRKMRAGLELFMTEVAGSDVRDGDVAWLGWSRGRPMHLAFRATALDGRPTLIHAFSLAGKVVEHGFAAEWTVLVDSHWRIPGIVD